MVAVAVAIAGWLLWRAWVRPLLDLRDLIRAIANGEASQPIVRSSLRPFTQISADLRRVADRLRRQRQRLADEGFSLRAILGSMVEGVIIVDPAQRIRLANDAVQTMFEFTQPPINRSVLEVFRHPELVAAIDRSFREVRTVILEIHEESRVGDSRPDRYFRIHLTPLMPTGGSSPEGVLAVFDDVTDVRSLEAVRREFVANVSHEFRTPLAIISGYVETLLDGALDDRPMAERSLQIIQKHGKRLNLLIDDLLAIAELEQGRPALKTEVADLGELIGRVVEQLDAQIREREAGIQLDLAERNIEVDAHQMEQVFFNLIGNALQHGGNEIRVTARRRNEEVEISIVDNGPGIPYRDQPHIFERFYRVHKDRSREAGGTGLGLSIVKHIVMAHGGHVSVRSTPGMGCVFKISLPVSKAGS